MNPRKSLITLMAGAALLAGCGNDDNPSTQDEPISEQPAPRPPAPAPAPGPAPQANDPTDAAFILTLSTSGLGFDEISASNSELIALGNQICDTMDQGLSREQVLSDLLVAGYSPEQAGFFYGAATAAYCPT